MRKVGLTGGIASGKSEVARLFAGYGALVVDADQVAREVVAPGTSGLAEIVAEFGPEVLGPDGALDRPKLGEIVFSDSAALARLNGIVHPRVGRRTEELMAAAPEGAIVVYDVPLLVENGLGPLYEMVVVVDAPVEIQIERLVRDRGLSEEQARARIGNQAPREQRLAAADIVVDNSGDLAALEEQAGRAWRLLSERT